MNRFYLPLLLMAIYATISGTAFKALLTEEHEDGYISALLDMPLETLQDIPIQSTRI